MGHKPSILQALRRQTVVLACRSVLHSIHSIHSPSCNSLLLSLFAHHDLQRRVDGTPQVALPSIPTESSPPCAPRVPDIHLTSPAPGHFPPNPEGPFTVHLRPGRMLYTHTQHPTLITKKNIGTFARLGAGTLPSRSVPLRRVLSGRHRSSSKGMLALSQTQTPTRDTFTLHRQHATAIVDTIQTEHSLMKPPCSVPLV
jgi:hypothetical protein